MESKKDHNHIIKNDNSIRRKNGIRSKEFITRNPLLDDLMENSKNMVAVYRLFLAFFLGCGIHLACYEYVHRGELNIGQKLIVASFSGLHKLATLWIGCFLAVCLLYYCFKHWAIFRTQFTPKSAQVKFWDYFCLVLFVMYLHGLLWLATWITLKQSMSILLTLIMTCEITRMLMKLHAFVRTNASRVLSYKPHCKELLYPSFSQFMYFLWVPTLIYRDSYPRTKCIRWNYIASKMVEFIAGAFYISITINIFIVIPFRDYGIKSYSWGDIAIIFTENAITGFILSIIGVYMVLHLWMSIFAEILKFGDRQFYEDWWTSSNFERFYRTWNTLIHDWLYTYVYKDFYEIVTPGNKIAAKYMVFLLSALFHEYILYVSFGFVLPIVFIQFFFLSTILTFYKFPEALGNTVIFYGIGLGNGVNCAAYGLEYFARLNCPIEDPTAYSYLVPRLFTCGSG